MTSFDVQITFFLWRNFFLDQVNKKKCIFNIFFCFFWIERQMTSKSTDFFWVNLFWKLRSISDKTIKFKPVTLKRPLNDINKQSLRTWNNPVHVHQESTGIKRRPLPKIDWRYYDLGSCGWSCKLLQMVASLLERHKKSPSLNSQPILIRRFHSQENPIGMVALGSIHFPYC